MSKPFEKKKQPDTGTKLKEILNNFQGVIINIPGIFKNQTMFFRNEENDEITVTSSLDYKTKITFGIVDKYLNGPTVCYTFLPKVKFKVGDPLVYQGENDAKNSLYHGRIYHFSGSGIDKNRVVIRLDDIQTMVKFGDCEELSSKTATAYTKFLSDMSLKEGNTFYYNDSDKVESGIYNANTKAVLDTKYINKELYLTETLAKLWLEKLKRYREEFFNHHQRFNIFGEGKDDLPAYTSETNRRLRNMGIIAEDAPTFDTVEELIANSENGELLEAEDMDVEEDMDDEYAAADEREEETERESVEERNEEPIIYRNNYTPPTWYNYSQRTEEDAYVSGIIPTLRVEAATPEPPSISYRNITLDMGEEGANAFQTAMQQHASYQEHIITNE